MSLVGQLNNTDIDDALILAVIAQESQGYPQLIACDGGIGLMQVTPGTKAPLPDAVRPYPYGPIWWDCYETSTISTGGRPPWEQLLEPASNISWGIWVLESAVARADGDIWRALGYYNCGETLYDSGEYSGCDRYARRVLFEWYPRILMELGREFCLKGFCIR